jgi:hypothetical protein
MMIMTDITTLLADLERLKSARRSGTKVVQFEDYRTEFRSDAELVAAIATLETEILGGAGPRNVVLRSPTNKGRLPWANRRRLSS